MKTEKDIDKLIGQFFEEETSKIAIPEGLEDRMSNLIDELAGKEKAKTKMRSLWIWVGSAAAAIALIVMAGNRYFDKQAADGNRMAGQSVSTVDDPELAYEETVKALALVSHNFNKGMEQLAQAETRIDKVNSVLDRTFKDRKQ